MASTFNVIGCGLVAAVLWTAIGLPIARRMLPALAWPVAPILGWAAHSAVLLAVFRVAGFSRWTVAIGFAVPLAAALMTLARPRRPAAAPDTWPVQEPMGVFPVWLIAGAALVALIPAAAILPKVVAEGVALSGPIFDHAKIAMVDEMVRLGLPPGNPVFEEGGGAGRLVYYYLWHFSAAELSLLLGATGWEADAALTWFTAFATLSLAGGLAAWIGGRPSAALWALLLSLPGSLRLTLDMTFGEEAVRGWLGWGFSGIAGLLFQASWAPQHVAAGSCVVVAAMLMARLAHAADVAGVVVLGLVAAAGIQASTWVGGVTFALVALAAGIVLLVSMPSAGRWRFTLACVAGAALAAMIAGPMLLEQFAANAQRGGGIPVAIHAQEVFGPFVPESIRRLLDLPAYWLGLLPLELPAIYPAGIAAAVVVLRRRIPNHDITVLAATAAACLAVTWLMVSRVGSNNDLGWRAILPALIVLTGFAGAAVAGALARRSRRAMAVAAIAVAALAAPGGRELIKDNLTGDASASASAFGRAPALWAAVRRHAGPADRVANNPLFLATMTPWPINISWALMANRRSCFASGEIALALVPLPNARRAALEAQFTRVFAGDGTADDIGDLATRYGCRVVAVVATDGAWRRDPFAESAHYRLAETEPERWRIYVAAQANAR